MEYHNQASLHILSRSFDEVQFNSDFAKNSKFQENFVGEIIEINKWNLLVSQFQKYLKNIKHEDNNKLWSVQPIP